MTHPQYMTKTIFFIAINALLTCHSGLLLAQSTTPTTSSSPLAGTPRPGEAVTLNFANAEIESVARAIGVMTGRSMVIDPRVKGNVTITTERPISPQSAYNQFLATIRLQGFTVVESAGLHKVVPEADAKLQGGAVSVGAVTTQGSQLQTQIFPLNFENANNLVPVLRPLISPNNTINVNPGNNSLIVTDYADNLQRIARIVAALDVSNASDVEVIPIRHGIAADLAPLVTRLVESGSGTAPGAAGAGQSDTSFRTTLIAEPRSNSLILRAANPARVALVKGLVAKLDQPASSANGNAGNIYVVHLKNADATKLAVTLRAAMVADNRSTTSPGSNASVPTASTGAAGTANAVTATSGTLGGTGNQPSTGGQIQADPATNTLIITAPEPQYRQLRAVIDKLDGRRAQVLVESLIVEVSSNKAAEFGIQLQGVIGKMALGTNFGTGASNLATLAANIATGSTSTTLASGLNVGVAQKVGGVYVLSALGRLLDQTGTGNVLSTPNLLTLDNEEAKIVIGQNVPFVTGSFASTGATGGTVNPFQTVERKDVGLTLRVRPQINENGAVKMVIYQEVSSVDSATKSDPNGPTTNKRSIESNVLVEDGAIVVLGGLMQDDYSGSEEKLPGLGDVPIIGNLFKTEKRTRKKTNLMVFLRPTVIRDGDTSDALTMDRYDLIRSQQQSTKPVPKVGLSAVPDNALLPELSLPKPNGAQVPKPLSAESVLLPVQTAPSR